MDPSTWNPFPSLLVTPEDLHRALVSQSHPRRIIPVAAGQTSSFDSYGKHHIPGSIFFNMEEIRDTNSPYPQMLPSAEHFSKCMAELGVHPDDILVIYDVLEVGLYSSPRVAWALRHFGHRDVHVLNNFPRYISQEYPIDSGPSYTLNPPQLSYPVKEPNAWEVISYEELRDVLLSDPTYAQFQIIDARIPGRFSGKEAELNPSLRSGHMPAALNVPLASILGPEKTIMSAEQLKSVFQAAGVDENLPVVLTCNSGVTAAALDLALQLSGYKMERRLYDGSWMEWTRRADNEGLIVNS
ncbi:Rhodanese-like domain-containing protein [Aspergillus granulosus]|uniref:Rhodanese-like domain-containing protein n=1 Tax=Aspergillus granulosus TaxID=176169 RepID=A0ABR4GXK7_9EURO